MRKVLGFLVLILTIGCGGFPPPVDPTPDTDVFVGGQPVRLTSDDQFICSGVVLEAGVVLTARHCIDAPMLAVEGHDVEALHTPYGELDLALLEVPTLDAPPAIFGQTPVIGAPGWVVGFGCSKGREYLVRAGILLVRQPGDGLGLFTTTVCPGDSGGPVYNDRDELIGITSFSLSGDIIELAPLELTGVVLLPDALRHAR